MSTRADTAPQPAAAQAPEQERHYGFSVLLTGLARMWRSTVPSLLWVLLNAVIQAGLVVSDPVVGWTWQFVSLCFASLVFLLLTGAVLSAAALRAVTSRVSLAVAMSDMRAHFPLFAGWVILQAIVITLGYAFYTLPGVILWAVTVFLPLAAIEGQRNALAANLRAIASHPFRWLITVIIVGIIALVGFLVGAVNTFFIGGPFAAFLANLVGGVFAWWFLTAWACLYRSRRGAAGADSAATSASDG